MPRAVLLTAVLVAAVGCTDQTTAEPPATTTAPVTTIVSVPPTTAPVETTPPSTTPLTTQPTTTTSIDVPPGPPVAPGAVRVTLGDEYVVTDDIMSAGDLTFDIYNGGDSTHGLRVRAEGSEIPLLESEELGPEEWVILDLPLDPGVYVFESDAGAIEVSVTG